MPLHISRYTRTKNDNKDSKEAPTKHPNFPPHCTYVFAHMLQPRGTREYYIEGAPIKFLYSGQQESPFRFSAVESVSSCRTPLSDLWLYRHACRETRGRTRSGSANGEHRMEQGGMEGGHGDRGDLSFMTIEAVGPSIIEYVPCI